MATKIRLARGGAKKRPFYRIVVADARASRDGSFIEKLGTFNPMVPKDNKDRLNFNKERVEHWLKTGAIPTERVQKFLAEQGIGNAPKITEKTKQHLPKKKAQERLKAKEEAAKAAEEAAKQEAEAAASAPAEEEVGDTSNEEQSSESGSSEKVEDNKDTEEHKTEEENKPSESE